MGNIFKISKGEGFTFKAEGPFEIFQNKDHKTVQVVTPLRQLRMMC